MSSYRNTELLPFETVRDLLGLARALYAAFQKMGPAYERQRWELRRIGSQLNTALDKAARSKSPGGWDHKTAWLIAEEATADLNKLVDQYLPAKLLITATGERLVRKK